MGRRGGLIFLLFAAPVSALDPHFAKIRDLLVPMRSAPLAHPEIRGATPEFTVIKHTLRDWIESRLGEISIENGPQELQHSLNRDLKQARLDDSSLILSTESFRGFLGSISIELKHHEFLVVRTAVGILCGFDVSAYAYRRAVGRWERFWQSEQNDYRKGHYSPQTIHSVLFSPPDYSQPDRTERLVLTLGFNPWCTSNWQTVYYRAWKVEPRAEPKLLLDQSGVAFLGNDALRGVLGASEVLVEYDAGSLDVDVHNRPEVRRYLEKDGKLTRVDPVALSPRDFVDVWLHLAWTEATAWTDSSGQREMAARARSHTGRRVLGSFLSPTLHCASQPDLWQVGVEFQESGTPVNQYFLVRWRPPYRFSMVAVTEQPSPMCTQPDAEADQRHTLFPAPD